MKTLIVYTHPHPESFNHALLETTCEALSAAGHEVRVKDLYAEGFDPVLKAADLDPAVSEPAEDVRCEQEAVSWAEALVFIYPLWWFDRPAILKGWFDRVFTPGFAFEYSETGERGLLPHKKAWVIVTTGGAREAFTAMNAESLIIEPVTRGTLGFCGIETIETSVLYAVPVIGEDERRVMLDEVRTQAAAF